MTKEQRRIILKIIQRSVPRLGLYGWDIQFDFQRERPDHWGEAYAISGRQFGIITLYEIPTNFKDLHQVVMHEMLHLRTWRTLSAGRRAKKGMGKKSFKVFLDAFMESLENDVDILSIGLSNQFIGEDKDLDRAWKKTLTP